MLIFIGLMGLWAGAAGARKAKNQAEDPWASALMGGLVAGLVRGLMVAILALRGGYLNQNGVRIAKYLSSVLPADVKLFLAGNTPIVGAILHFRFVDRDRPAGRPAGPRHGSRQLACPPGRRLEK